MLRVWAMIFMMILSGCTLFRPSAAPQPDTQASKKAPDKLNDVTACDRLSVTAEWQGAETPEQKKTCTYSAPANCRILYSPTTVHSENNGFFQTLISADAKSLSATVSARPHGSTKDRKKGWIDISVLATLDCRQ